MVRKRGISKQAMHELLGNTSSGWTGSADQLMKCAAVLWDYWSRQGDGLDYMIWQILMLRGMAVENLVKAILADEGHVFSVGGRLRHPKVKQHDLLALARLLNGRITTSGKHERMLIVLSRAITHLGRYPIPVNAQDLAIHTPEGLNVEALWSAEYEGLFWEVIHQLGLINPSYAAVSKMIGRPFFEGILESVWKRIPPATGEPRSLPSTVAAGVMDIVIKGRE